MEEDLLLKSEEQKEEPLPSAKKQPKKKGFAEVLACLIANGSACRPHWNTGALLRLVLNEKGEEEARVGYGETNFVYRLTAKDVQAKDWVLFPSVK